MKRLTVLGGLLLGVASAQTCDAPKQTVAFVNGIFTDVGGAVSGGAQLADAIHAVDSDTEVKVYWNPGGKGANLTDAVQTLVNKLIQENALFDGIPAVRLYNSILHYFMGDQAPLVQLTQAQQDAIVAASSNLPIFAQQRTGEDQLRQNDSVLASTNKVRDLAVADLSKGNKVVLVTHSQGNFYGKEAYRLIARDYPDLIGGLGVEGVASVTRSIPGGTYVSYIGDLVVTGVILFDPSTLPLNHSESFLTQAKLLLADPVGHGFGEIYMNPAAGMRERIVREAMAKFPTLTTPQGSNGPVTATLTWNTPGDVDLHTTEPGGAHVYYLAKVGGAGSLDWDDTTGTGPEHYYTSCQNVQLGTYQFGVNYYNGSGPRVATVTVNAVGVPSRSASVTLPTALGSGGNNSPVPVFDVVLSKVNGRLQASVNRR